MNRALDGPPTLELNPYGRFPRRSEFGRAWSGVVGLSRSWRGLDCADYLESWCGASPGDCTDRFSGVNHVGIYLGDYQQDDEVLAWNSHLVGLRDAGEIVHVEMGPSYISPRQYGTQGWWLSVTLPDGGVIETFTCKWYGRWRERTVQQRRTLMSHVALDVWTEPDVRHVLDRLEHAVESLEVIAFTEGDDLGHTYGHLRNNASNSVLEVVYQAPPPSSDGGQDHGDH